MWETVEQRGAQRSAEVSASLVTFRGGAVRLCVTVSGPVGAKLGWAYGDRLVLAVGRGRLSGRVRLARAGRGEVGAYLRRLPRSQYLSVMLAVPEDMASWTAPKREAEHEIQPNGTLVLTLPWELAGEAPGQEAEAA